MELVDDGRTSTSYVVLLEKENGVLVPGNEPYFRFACATFCRTCIRARVQFESLRDRLVSEWHGRGWGEDLGCTFVGGDGTQRIQDAVVHCEIAIPMRKREREFFESVRKRE